jgi:glycosyltransferase involved in cell wall biosynthesis
MYTGNCPHAGNCYQWVDGCKKCQCNYPAAHKSFILMKEAFEHFQNLSVVSVSPWLMERAKMSVILKSGNHVTIENGINTDIFHYHHGNKTTRRMNELFTGKTVLYVTANFLDENKGGQFVIRLAKCLPNIRFVMIGYNSNEILPDNVTGIQYIQDQNDLASCYNLADVTLLTSKRETFGMTVAESLCCGTPVVGFLSGGPETIAIKEYSSFSTYADMVAIRENLEYWLDAEYDKEEISRVAIEKYNSRNMYKQYLKLYQRILYQSNFE